MIYSYAVQGQPPRLVFHTPERPCLSLAVTAALYEAVCAAVTQYGDRWRSVETVKHNAVVVPWR